MFVRANLTKRMLPALAGVLALLLSGVAGAAVKKSIAVAPVGWTAGTVSWTSGEAIQAQLISELNNSGDYRVVERENLEGILGEQDLGTGGRLRGKSAPKTGDLEGAQLMIKAVVTGAEESSGEGGNVGFRGMSMGKDTTKYKITMDVRVYDMQTGLIIGTETVSAEQVKESKGGGMSFGGMSLGQKKSGGDTTSDVIRGLIQESIAKLNSVTKAVEWKSYVNSISGEKIIVVGGERDGLEKGMEFKVFELGEPVKDATTGEVLDEGEETEVGLIKVTEVKPKISYCEKVSGKDPAQGNLIKLVMSAGGE